jgi:surface antigen
VGLALFASASVATVSRPVPAEATTHGKGNVVLFIHGWDKFSAHDCAQTTDGFILPLKDTMAARGFKGKLVTVGWYPNDLNCDVNIADIYQYYDPERDLTFDEYGYYLNDWIYNTYTAHGIPVDIVTHSVGGLISRAALQFGTSAGVGYTAGMKGHLIDVSDAVTISTPHDGVTGFWEQQCSTTECNAYVSGSLQLNWLNNDGNRNEQGIHGTEWTTIGSSGDTTVDSASANYMDLPATNEVEVSGVCHVCMTTNDAVHDRVASALIYDDGEIDLARPSWTLYNTSLMPSEQIVSTNGCYRLHMEQNGDLALWRNWECGGSTILPIWHSSTYSSGAYLAMQDDGNLVIYSSSSCTTDCGDKPPGSPIWATGTYGRGKSHVVVTDDGNLVVYTGAPGGANPTVTWSLYPLGGSLGSPDELTSASTPLVSPNGQYRLQMQADGNLVQYNAANQPTWSSNTWGNPGAYLKMQDDGNLVIYTRKDTPKKPIWASRTDGRGPSHLEVQNDGNVVIYPYGQAASWATSWRTDNMQPTTEIRGLQGSCLDVKESATTNGTPIRAWYDCNGTNAQKWTYSSRVAYWWSAIRSNLKRDGKFLCLDASDIVAESNVHLYECHGGINQQWRLEGDGSIRLAATDRNNGQSLCLDVPHGELNKQLVVYYCNGGPYQRWYPNSTSRATGDTWENRGVNYNPFPEGYCTWGAMQDWYWFTGKHLYVVNDAHQWNEQAQAAGWTVTNTPEANSLVVFERGVQGADALGGHVAWVDGINADGTLRIHEMNSTWVVGGGFNKWNYRNNVSVVPGMSFILAPGTRQQPRPV